jgi:hypothetical protein
MKTNLKKKNKRKEKKSKTLWITKFNHKKKKSTPPKPVNRGNLDYLIKLANHANLIKRQNKKKKNYESKFSTTTILKDEINKNKFLKNHNRKKQKKKTQNTMDFYYNSQCTGCG